MKKFILLLVIIVSLCSLTMYVGVNHAYADGDEFPIVIPDPPLD